MPDEAPNQSPVPPPVPGFPFITAALALVTLFLFVGLMVVAYQSPSYFRESEPVESIPDPAKQLDDLKARNQALLDGQGAKMPVSAASAELLRKLKSEKDRLPFPKPPQPPPPMPEEKKQP